VLDKRTCERCGKQYRMRTISENKARYFCADCLKKCSVCGNKLPMAHWFGQTCSVTQGFVGNVFTQAMERQEKPWIGSGLCLPCYQAKVKKEQEEQQLLRQAQLVQAKETIETPSTWTCSYCNAVNRGNFCFNCGSARQKIVTKH